MQALRTSTRTLRLLPSTSSAHQTRSLRVTGPSTFSYLLTSEQPQKSKSPRAAEPSSAKPSRQFNTNRALKAVKDNSPVDLTFIPDLVPEPVGEPTIIMPIVGPAEADNDVSAFPNLFAVSGDSSRIHAPAAEESMVRHLWTGLKEDLFGGNARRA